MFLLKENKRLTQVNDIMNHKWFADHVDWSEIKNKTMEPPFVPSIVKNGKHNFTKVELRDAEKEEDLKIVNNNYEVFSSF